MQDLRRAGSTAGGGQGARSEMSIGKTMMLEEVAMVKLFNASE